GGKAAASWRIHARSAGASGPARQTSVPSAPTVGSKRPRAIRPTPAAAAAAPTCALSRIRPQAPPPRRTATAASSGRRTAEIIRLRMPYVPPGKTSSTLADPVPRPQCANAPRRGVSPGTKTSSPSSTAPYDTGSVTGFAGTRQPGPALIPDRHHNRAQETYSVAMQLLAVGRVSTRSPYGLYAICVEPADRQHRFQHGLSEGNSVSAGDRWPRLKVRDRNTEGGLWMKKLVMTVAAAGMLVAGLAAWPGGAAADTTAPGAASTRA